MAETQPTQRAWRSIAAGFLELGLIAGTFGAHLPDLKARAGLSNGQIGLVLAAAAVGGVLGVAVNGRLVGRLGVRTVLLVVAVLLPLASLGPALAATLPTALVVGLLFGACDGTIDVAINVGGGAVERLRGRASMSGFHALFSLGAAVGAGSAAGAAALGIRPFAHVAIVAAVGLALGTAGARGYPLRAEPSAERVAAPDRPPALWPVLRPLLPVVLVVWAAQVAEGVGYDWTAVYARDSLAAGAVAGGVLYAVYTGSMTLGRATGDRLTERFGRLTMVRRGSLLAGVGLGAALLVGGLPAAFVGFACLGLGLATVVPIVFGLAASEDDIASARVLALLAGTGRIAFLGGPVLVGFLGELGTLRVALGLAAVLALVAAAGGAQVTRLPGYRLSALGRP